MGNRVIKERPKQAAAEEFMEQELVRIFSTDIPGEMFVYPGLTRIKGVSWTFSNALCFSLKIDKSRKISSLTQDEIAKINSFLKSPKLPEWLLNRRQDIETGISRHVLTTDLDVTREWDIRKMKKMKSFKGWRHSLGQPVRGQRTKSHFRKGGVVGVKKGKAKEQAKPAEGGKKK